MHDSRLLLHKCTNYDASCFLPGTIGDVVLSEERDILDRTPLSQRQAHDITAFFNAETSDDVVMMEEDMAPYNNYNAGMRTPHYYNSAQLHQHERSYY